MLKLSNICGFSCYAYSRPPVHRLVLLISLQSVLESGIGHRSVGCCSLRSQHSFIGPCAFYAPFNARLIWRYKPFVSESKTTNRQDWIMSSSCWYLSAKRICQQYQWQQQPRSSRTIKLRALQWINTTIEKRRAKKNAQKSCFLVISVRVCVMSCPAIRFCPQSTSCSCLGTRNMKISRGELKLCMLFYFSCFLRQHICAVCMSFNFTAKMAPPYGLPNRCPTDTLRYHPIH